jgi:DNA-binding transcriptional ArsR family regulator
MLRIHFTAADLIRIQIRSDPHPLWEVLLSLHMLQTHDGVVTFDAWRRRARTVLPARTEMLTTLARPKGYSPDFLTPATSGADLESGLEALLSTPRRRLRADIERLGAQTHLPSWAGEIANGDAGMVRQLGNSVRQYYDCALRPYWPSIRAHIQADRIQRSEVAVNAGFEQVLKTLHPAVRWRTPVLEVNYPLDQDLHLDGRGLVLAPSFFCWQQPITLADPGQQPILLYPVERELTWMTELGDEQPARPHLRSLGALIGRTRATILNTIAGSPGLNTTELARAVGISPAGASQHATVLRDAGLITTFRHGGYAAHEVSPRGTNLLERPGHRVHVTLPPHP